MTALIKFTQGVNTDNAGRALIGDLSGPVVASNGNDAGVVKWTYQMLDVPPESAVPKSVQSGVTPTYTFTPDVAGSYRMLEITEDSLGNVDTDIRVFSVPFTNGLISPPYQGNPRPLPASGAGSKPNEMNFQGQARGWAGTSYPKLLHELIKKFDTIWPFSLSNTGTKHRLVTVPPNDRQGTASLAAAATFAATVSVDTNNRIHRTTWTVRAKFGGVDYVCDYYTVTKRSSAGAITSLVITPLPGTHPVTLAFAWGTSANVAELRITNNTGAAIEIWVAAADHVEDIS